jgi:hypothetical protein
VPDENWLQVVPVGVIWFMLPPSVRVGVGVGVAVAVAVAVGVGESTTWQSVMVLPS